jgi:hypothetical protein
MLLYARPFRSCGPELHRDRAVDRGRIVLPRCGFPGYRALPEHAAVEEQFAHWAPIRAQIETLLAHIVVDEALADERDHVKNPTSEDFRIPLDYARDTSAFYMCSWYKTPYFGGHAGGRAATS